jgi:hypothetical protein
MVLDILRSLIRMIGFVDGGTVLLVKKSVGRGLLR